MPSREKDRVRDLVCHAIAAEWAGADPDADALRSALQEGLNSLWQRADRVSRDATTQTMARLLAEIISKQPNGTVPAGTDPADQAARQLARLLLMFLPGEARSLAGLVASMGRPSPPAAPAASPPAWTSPDTVAPDDGEPSPTQTFERLLTDPAQLAAAWPSSKKMGELIKQILDRIRGLGCLGGLADVVTWETYVIPRMATSYAVAAAVQQAFKTLDLTGVVSSTANLGSIVHGRVSSSMAAGMAPMLDRYLVADHAVYRLGIRSSFTEEAERTRLQGELSLTLLRSSRGESDPIGRVRARGTKTSRDDLVVFFGPTVGSLPGPFASGRPEVWEIKPIGELLTAVSQVSAYSLNYLAASFWARCKGLGGARIDNSIMLPGSPEAPAIPIPSISLTGIATAAAGGPPATAAQITQLVAQFMKSSVSAGSVVAVPFVISGLYGVVPYFVLDLGKLKQLVEAALKLIIEALIAALMAYLAAKKLLEKLADVGLEIAKVLGGILLFLVVAVLAFLLAAALAPILAELAVVLVIAGVIALILRGTTSQGPGGGSQPSDPSATLLDIQLGPLSLQGISAARFADTVATLRRLYDAFWRDSGAGPAVA